MKAIIVPGVTDLNKGDQALVWESHRLISDSGRFEQILILENGDTPEENKKLCEQSQKKGFRFAESILKHPRRGKHSNNEHISDSYVNTLRMIANSLMDFVANSLLLILCNKSWLVKVIYSKKTYEGVKKFEQSDVVFVKGGGFIHSYGGLTSTYSIWYSLFYIKLAKRLNKIVVVLPNSYGPFDGFLVKKQVSSALANVDLLLARESVSASQLGDLLDKTIKRGPDLGFFLEPQVSDRVDETLSDHGLQDKQNLVGITVRPWRFPNDKSSFDRFELYIKTIKEFCLYLISNGYHPVLCNQAMGPNLHEDDRVAISKVVSGLKGADEYTWINENFTCEETKYLYSKLYSLVGTRFHSVIFSLSSNVPVISIGYGGNKSKGIMNDLGLLDYHIDIESSNLTELIQMFEKVETNYEHIKATLLSNMGHVKSSRREMLAHIVALS